MDCALGRAGITGDKREGDHATPRGLLVMREAFYRADRLARPLIRLPIRPLEPHDGWCDDPLDRCYNRPVRHPYPASAERLWREDHLYDLIVVLGHNDQPPVPGRGSAIFLHVARPDFGPTEGCVALQLEDLLALLQSPEPPVALDVR
jgi:L,D-peptidoglycan transpeptidase YkuD (ErfK/YbiS/YcfS/YnhG family)